MSYNFYINGVQIPTGWSITMTPYPLESLVEHRNGGLYLIKQNVHRDAAGVPFYDLELQSNPTDRFVEQFLYEVHHDLISQIMPA